MNTAFDEKQYEMLYPDGIENHYWFSARNQIIEKALKRHTFENENIIEIGCGRGVVVKYLNENGLNCLGVELSACTPSKGAENMIITGVDAFELDQEYRNKFSTLLLLDVIEHIENPVQFVNTILERYINIQKIIFTVPARQEIWSEHDVFNGHFRRYDLDMTSDLVKRLAYKIDENTYLFQSLYLLTKFLTSIGINRKKQIHSPKGIGKIIHRILSRYLMIENLLFTKNKKGSSIICIASKPNN